MEERKSVVVDIRGIGTRQEIHEYLQETLPFTGYFGKNLDALYDVLTSVGEDVELVLLCDMTDPNQLSFLRVMLDAEEENDHLTVVLAEVPGESEEEKDGEDDPFVRFGAF